MRIHHYIRRTEEPYWGWIRRFILFSGKRHPREMDEAEVQGFLTHLAREKSWRDNPESGDLRPPVSVSRSPEVR